MKTLIWTSMLSAAALMAQTGSAPAPKDSTTPGTKATTPVKRKSHHKKSTTKTEATTSAAPAAPASGAKPATK